MLRTLRVKVGRLPGRIVEVVLNTGALVEDALRAAELEFEDGQQVTRGGQEVELDTKVQSGDTILLVEQIAGA